MLAGPDGRFIYKRTAHLEVRATQNSRSVHAPEGMIGALILQVFGLVSSLSSHFPESKVAAGDY
jgi:hypothetical protein